MDTYAISVAVVTCKGKVLILKRSPDRKYSPNKWEFVSGLIKEGESTEKTAVREVKEETGLNGKIVKSGKSFEAIDEFGRWIIIPFLVEVKTRKIKMSKEHVKNKWVAPKEVTEYEGVVDLKKDLKSVGLL